MASLKDLSVRLQLTRENQLGNPQSLAMKRKQAPTLPIIRWSAKNAKKILPSGIARSAALVVMSVGHIPSRIRKKALHIKG